MKIYKTRLTNGKIDWFGNKFNSFNVILNNL